MDRPDHRSGSVGVGAGAAQVLEQSVCQLCRLRAALTCYGWRLLCPRMSVLLASNSLKRVEHGECQLHLGIAKRWLTAAAGSYKPTTCNAQS